MKKLDHILKQLISRLSAQDQQTLCKSLSGLQSIYPFNKHEYVLAYIMGQKKMTLNEYLSIRSEYLKRNPYLYLFELSSPRGFGEQWAQKHLEQIEPKLKPANKKWDSHYVGQYDMVYRFSPHDLIRIEAKASRAVNSQKSQAPLYAKALSWEDDEDFVMNFQQIKPSCCDVFVWVGVWRDVIKYWVLSSQDVAGNSFYSRSQHRGGEGEGQLHLRRDNIEKFDLFLCSEQNMLEHIVRAYHRCKKLSSPRS